MVIAAGIDGYRKGWVAIVLEDGRYRAALARPTLKTPTDGLATSVAIGSDIPIGLPDRGRRPADEEARRFVGPRRSSVFLTASRAVWEAADDVEARTTHQGRSALARATVADVRRMVPSPSGAEPHHIAFP